MERGDTDDQVAIVITTFEARQATFCLPLVAAIRESGCTAPVIVVVNGNPSASIDLPARSEFLRSLATHHDVHPVCLREMAGLARLWNLGIQAAATEICVLLNDDLVVAPELFLRDLASLSRVARDSGVAVGNGSWSHFAISRDCIQELGWFEERLLGFGEEDGDFATRYRHAFGTYPQHVPISGIYNVVAAERQRYATGVGKYSQVNRTFMSLKYEFRDDGHPIEVEPPLKPQLPDLATYPGEDFRWATRGLLDESDQARIRSQLIAVTEAQSMRATSPTRKPLSEG